MKQKISKTETQNKIEEFFSNIKNKSPKEIKKIKRLAMNKKISLKEKRKLFCKKCLTPYSGNERIRIKNNSKVIECKNCKVLNRIKLN
jgi:RNase P subunit RPR2